MSDENTGVYQIAELAAKVEEGVAYLMVLSGEDAGTILKLMEGQYSLGRSSEANIRVRGDGVSREHAKILVYADGSLHATDLGSTNGSYLNGQRIDAEWVEDGSQLQFGSVILIKFSREEDAEERFDQQLYQSTTQALTGVYNAQFFDEQLRKDFSHAVRHNSSLSLVVFAVDGLDALVDERGQQLGDAMVRWTAKTVAGTIRKEDVLCRIDDNRFVVLMRDCPARNAFLFAQRIQQEVEGSTFDAGGEAFTVTISAGVVTLKKAIHSDPDAFVGDAERYLARAIARGQNRVEGSLQDF